jgi:hypothetical protein
MPPNIYEPGRALTWLQSVLAPLASGGAWHGVAPEGVTTPFIVYALQAANDLAVVGGYRVWSDGVYQVKVCGPSTISGTLATIADSVDNALQRQRGVNVGADSVMLSCTREQTLILPEIVANGAQWLNYILLYRIYTQAV